MPKAVILAGGLGTRLSEETVLRPKPMVEVGGKPLLWHVMKIYAAHGVTDFVICCGFKGYVIKEYFANYFLHMSDITFVAPASGALGWIDTFALPRKTKAEDAAYKWINFVMQPKIAAMITEAAGNFTASQGADAYVNDTLKAQYQESFPPADVDNIKWYPPVPAGLEEIEGKVLDRVKAAG